MTVSIRELKNGLSEYLRRVKEGERLVVTDRGRPVAELSPVSSARLSSEERMDRLARAGELVRGKGGGLPDLEPTRVRGRPVSATLLEDRG